MCHRLQWPWPLTSWTINILSSHPKVSSTYFYLVEANQEGCSWDVVLLDATDRWKMTLWYFSFNLPQKSEAKSPQLTQLSPLEISSSAPITMLIKFFPANMESKWWDDVWQVPRVSRWQLSACVFSVFRDSVYTGFTPVIMSGVGNDKNACTSTLHPSASVWGGSSCTWLQLHKKISLNTNYVCASLCSLSSGVNVTRQKKSSVHEGLLFCFYNTWVSISIDELHKMVGNHSSLCHLSFMTCPVAWSWCIMLLGKYIIIMRIV